MRRVVHVATIALLLAGVVAPLGESAALAAQRRAKPSLRRRPATRTARAAKRPQVVTPASKAQVVGPAYTTYTLPQGQYFRLRVNQTVSSESARAGDRFTTTVVTPVYVSGIEVVPAGSVIEGHVTVVVPARSRGREGQIAIQFDALVLPDGTRRQIEGLLTELQSDKSTEVNEENEVSGKTSETRQIVYVGGGTAGGAVLGGAIGGGKGAAIGAAIGAGAGVAGALLSKGNEAVLAGGAEIGMITAKPILFSVRADR